MIAFGTLDATLGGMILVKSTLLLVAAFVASFLFRHASASARHLLWALSFTALLALPVLTYLSSVESRFRIPVPVPTTTVLESERALHGPVQEATSRPSPSVELPASDVAAIDRAPSSPSWSAKEVFVSIWALGVVLFLGRIGLGWIASRRELRRSRPVSNDWTELLTRARGRIGLHRRVQLREADGFDMPMTLGLLEPAILLPESAARYSLPRRWAVLLHELAHVRRRDCWTQLASQIACAIYWWHPLAWIGAKRMRLLSERASDDLVLRAGTEPTTYAHDLLDMAKGLAKGRRTPLGSVTMAHRTRFEERLLAILDPKTVRNAVSMRWALATATTALLVFLSLGLAVPTAVGYRVEAPGPEPLEPPARETETEAPAAATEVAEAVAQTGEAPEPEQEQKPEAARRPDAEPQTETQPEAEVVMDSADSRARARRALAKALDDPEASVRDQALHALVQLGDESILPHLQKALGDEEPEMRAEAAWGLGQLAREDAVPSLLALLDDPSEEVREQAAWALGRIESEAAVSGLAVAVVEDADPNVREQAAWALGMIEVASGVQSLMSALSDAEEDVREQAAWGLGKIEDPRAVPGLVQALTDSSAGVREQVAWALGMIGDPGAIDALSLALEDEDADVREQAAWALGRIAEGDDDIDLDVDVEGELDIDVEVSDAAIP